MTVAVVVGGEIEMLAIRGIRAIAHQLPSYRPPRSQKSARSSALLSLSLFKGGCKFRHSVQELYPFEGNFGEVAYRVPQKGFSQVPRLIHKAESALWWNISVTRSQNLGSPFLRDPVLSLSIGFSETTAFAGPFAVR